MAQDACKQPCIHDTYIRNDAIIQGAGDGHAHDGHVTRNMREQEMHGGGCCCCCSRLRHTTCPRS